MYRIEIEQYEPAAAGVVTKRVPVEELKQYPDWRFKVEKYEQEAAGIVTRYVPVRSLFER